jgi:hypothetical protein
MRRLAAILAFGAALPMFAVTQRPLIVSTQDHTLVTSDDCEHFQTHTMTSFPSQVGMQEQRRVELEGVDVLRVRASSEGGVTVRGWDRPIARLTICKYAVALNPQDAQKTLRDVAVFSRNGEITTSGPENDTSRAWWVHMILRVPKSAALDVTSSNGGIAIRNMNGRVIAHATNGGISIASCNGDSKVSTENGGISVEHVGGRIEALTLNGPISYRLEAGELAPAIEARTADEGGDIFCRVKGCDEARSLHSGNEKVLRIGGAIPRIRLSTGKAPILIENVR